MKTEQTNDIFSIESYKGNSGIERFLIAKEECNINTYGLNVYSSEQF